MLIIHELGHVLAAGATGGAVERIVLVPWAFSRTDLSRNPHPGVVAWAGPLVGGFLPLLAWSVCARLGRRAADLSAFFAGFCLIANGAYLAVGLVLPVGDAEDLLRMGVPPWALALAGAPMVALGLWRWHALGSQRRRTLTRPGAPAPSKH
jgi:hypothetical protein